ncbi:MAG: Plug domain-containing protein [Bacteroidia bacterium]|jgi:hypothetical protein|nr:Plug domain-containing protein [Bacteroidia bacterium]
MKLILLSIFTCCGFYGFAQQSTEADLDPRLQQTYIITDYTNVFPQRTTQVTQTTGKRFSGDEMMRLARRDVNGIAALTAGVDSRPGTNETPNIRGGGASGTAYFVDGVRIYGALPMVTK